MTIIVAFIVLLCGPLPRPLRLTAVTLTVITFVLMVGGGAPITRAAIMGLLGFWVIHHGRIASGWILLLLATVAMSLWQPLHLLYDPSLQLSVAGVVGLLAFGEPCKKFVGYFTSSTFLQEVVAITLAAQLGVLPALLWHFGDIPLLSPLANLLIGPLIPAAMLLSFVTVVISLFSTLIATFFGFLAFILLQMMLWMIALLASLPFTVWAVGVQRGSIFFIVILVLIALAFFVHWRLPNQSK